MQVKKCPKCGTENKPTNMSCSKCYAAIEDVQLTESIQADQPVAPVAAQAPSARPAGPATAPPSATYAPPQPVNTTHSAPTPPDSVRMEYEREARPILLDIHPVEKKPVALIVTLSVISLAVLVAAIVILRPKPKPFVKPSVPPTAVVRQFLNAKKTNQLAKCKPYLCADNIHYLDTAFSDKQARSAGFDDKEVGKMFLFDVPPTAGDITVSNITTTDVTPKDAAIGTAVVHVNLESKYKERMILLTDFEYALVVEDGRWKLDLELGFGKGGGGGGGPMKGLMPGGG